MVRLRQQIQYASKDELRVEQIHSTRAADLKFVQPSSGEFARHERQIEKRH